MRNLALSRISPATANRLQRWITRLCLCAPLLLAGASGHAETYYKWKNDNGSWEYGAHPPAHKHAIEIKTTVTKAVQANSSGEDGAEAPSTAQSALEMEFAEKRKVSKKKNAEYCQTARSNLEALGSKAVIRRRDADGNVTVVSEQERKQEMEKAEVAIERYCG